jgi:hypothetical protein
MSFIGKSLHSLERSVASFSLEVASGVIPPKWIAEAAQLATRPTERDRDLPGPFVTWLVIAMGLFRSLGIPNVLRRLGNALGADPLWEGKIPQSTSVTEARDRLGFGALRWLLRQFQDWLLNEYREAMSWRGLLVLILDGTTFKAPDSPENRRHFGLPGVCRGGRASFPQLRALFLVSAKLRLVLRAWFAPYRRQEVTLAMRMLDDIPRGALLVMDRAYLAWWLLWRIQERGDHFLVRVRRKIRRRRLYSLGPAEWISRVPIPRNLRYDHPELPHSIELREIAVRIRGHWFHYFTSLNNPCTHPVKEIVELYARRWEVETGLDELKTHQGHLSTVNHPVLFRSKEPRRVMQEAYGLVIGYNLVRTLMLKAAIEHAVDPLRLSFVDTLDRIREAAPVMAAAQTRDLPWIYAQLLNSIAECRVPLRDRTNPREVCTKMSNYPKKWKSACA